MDAVTFKFEENGKLKVNIQRALAPSGDADQDLSIPIEAGKTYKVQGWIAEFDNSDYATPNKVVAGAVSDWIPVTQAYYDSLTTTVTDANGDTTTTYGDGSTSVVSTNSDGSST